MKLQAWVRLMWDRSAAVALIGIGALAILLGWIGASGEGLPAKQVPYVISGGIGGVFVLGLAALFWLSSDLRDEWTRLGRIEDAIHELKGQGEARTGPGAVPTEAPGTDTKAQRLKRVVSEA